MTLGTEIWLAICAALMTALTGLITIIYRDIGTKLTTIAMQNGKLTTAVVSLLVAKISNDDGNVVKALHDLLANNVNTIVIK